MTNRLVDWRELSRDQAASLYVEQTQAWAGALGWDLTGSWAVIERARAAGALPGRACLNRYGAIVGWTFFMRQGEAIQIGALTGKGAGPVRDLLESVLDAPESAGARELTCLLYPARPNALSALARRRFELQTLHYMSKPTAVPSDGAVLPEEIVLRRWADQDAIACVRVLARAYGRSQSGKGLAPNGTLEEWAHYLGQVLRTPACGTVMPRASFVAEERTTGAPVAFILATTIGSGTAHVAQVAVDPSWARRGIGRALLRSSLRASAGAAGNMTLLVSGDNAGAIQLYAREGFTETSQFVFASRSMPVRRQSHPRAA